MCQLSLNYFLATINKKITWALAQKYTAILNDSKLEQGLLNIKEKSGKNET